MSNSVDKAKQELRLIISENEQLLQVIQSRNTQVLATSVVRIARCVLLLLEAATERPDDQDVH